MDLTDDEILALRELLVYGRNISETVDSGDAVVRKVRDAARKIMERRTGRPIRRRL